MAAAGFSSEWSPARRALGAGCQEPAKAAKRQGRGLARPEELGAAGGRVRYAPSGTREAAPGARGRACADALPRCQMSKS